MDSHRRSITKALTWRAIATTITMTLAYIWSHDVTVAASIGAADVVLKLVAYYLHERAWLNVEENAPVITGAHAAVPSTGVKTC